MNEQAAVYNSRTSPKLSDNFRVIPSNDQCHSENRMLKLKSLIAALTLGAAVMIAPGIAEAAVRHQPTKTAQVKKGAKKKAGKKRAHRKHGRNGAKRKAPARKRAAVAPAAAPKVAAHSKLAPSRTLPVKTIAPKTQKQPLKQPLKRHHQL
jgi:hypothetical protein